MKVPFLNFSETNKAIKQDLVHSFSEFIDSNWYVLGEKVKAFEEAFSNYSGVSHTIGVGNGLDAITLSLKSLGIKAGDEVIVPSNTYIATVLAVSQVGATPVFVEPDINSYNIDPTKIKEKITNKTKAILPVHLYGQPCKMDDILQIANEHNLYVVEDNAQAQGATYSGKKTGSFGHINATSFYPSKNLGGYGDGGAITTDNEKLAATVRCLRNYGSEVRYYNKLKGYNSRLDELQAAFLNIKLQKLNGWNETRNEIANLYYEGLKNISEIITPVVIDKAQSVFHLYVIRTKDQSTRDNLQKFLAEQGIQTLIHYPVPPHLQEAYKELNFREGDFPIAEQLAQTSISLPIYVGLTPENIEYICTQIQNFYS